MGERERQAEHARGLRAVVAGTEQPYRGPIAQAGCGGDAAVRGTLGKRAIEVAEQLDQLLGEVVDGLRERIAAQSAGSQPVGAGRASDAEVDAPGVQRL